MKCIICGIGFTPNKYNKNKQKYCSLECHDVMHRKQCVENIQRKRRSGYYNSNGNAIRNGTSELSDLSIITFNGQERIKGMVVLEALINKMKRDKSILFGGEHL